MYLLIARIELDSIRRPEELGSVAKIEMKVEEPLALALHAHFDFVKILQIEVVPYSPVDVDVTHLPGQL